jgi:hypothetical protein
MRLYPDYSGKTIGSSATQSYREKISTVDVEYDNSTRGLEVLYHRTGEMVFGPTELRCALKYNDIKPRIYYARGPDQYYCSKYIQAIMNVLVDQFGVTHRFDRFTSSSVTVEPFETLFIYDYSSFTSKLVQLRSFTYHLANFFEDYITVEIVDTHKGPMHVSVKQLLLAYNDACNNFPSFEISDILNLGAEWTFPVLEHHCGMLGVPGNISSSTLLHGIYLMLAILSIICKVIGDDALAKGLVEDEDELNWALSGIGDANRDKTELWRPESEEVEDLEDDSWHYTKRPINRVAGRAWVDSRLVVWPSIGTLCPKFGTSLHRPSGITDTYKIAKRCASAMITFVNQFQGYTLSEQEIHFIDEWIWFYYSECDICIRRAGKRDRRRDLVYPISVSEGMNHEDWVSREWYTVHRLPVEADFIALDDRPNKMEKYCSRFNRALKLGRDLGYVTLEPKIEEVLVADHEDRFRRFISKDLRNLCYDVVILEDCPSWIYELIVSESCSPDASALDDVDEIDLDIW